MALKFGVKEQELTILPAVPVLKGKPVNADLWFASMINHTRKKQTPIQVYNEKIVLSEEEQRKFVEGVRDNSIGRKHDGAGVVIEYYLDSHLPSFAVTSFAEGYFYNIQQTTRRGVKIKNIICQPELLGFDGVVEDFNNRFEFYYEKTKEEKEGGFNKLIQGSMGSLPLCIESSFDGPFSNRTLREYSSWRKNEDLPYQMREFGRLIDEELTRASLMSQTKTMRDWGLKDLINGRRVDEDPSSFYPDTTMYLPSNPFFERLWNSGVLDDLKKPGPNAVLLHNYNPFDLTLDEMLDGVRNRDDRVMSAMADSYLQIATKNNLAAGIDERRHVTTKKMVQPLTHLIENEFTLAEPTELKDYKSDVRSLNNDTKRLVEDLKGKMPMSELIQVFPHNLEVIMVEGMDYYSLFNIFAKRDCNNVRDAVYQRTQAIKRVLESEFPGISNRRLATGVQFGVCYEMAYKGKGCKACGKDVIYTF